MTARRATEIGFGEIVSSESSAWEIQTAGPGPQGSLPLTAEMLLERPSGDIFGMTQNAGMGWDPRELGRPQFLMLSTQGGIRAADGRPIALGYHTGHWEVGLLAQRVWTREPVPQGLRAQRRRCPPVPTGASRRGHHP